MIPLRQHIRPLVNISPSRARNQQPQLATEFSTYIYIQQLYEHQKGRIQFPPQKFKIITESLLKIAISKIKETTLVIQTEGQKMEGVQIIIKSQGNTIFKLMDKCFHTVKNALLIQLVKGFMQNVLSILQLQEQQRDEILQFLKLMNSKKFKDNQEYRFLATLE